LQVQQLSIVRAGFHAISATQAQFSSVSHAFTTQAFPRGNADRYNSRTPSRHALAARSQRQNSGMRMTLDNGKTRVQRAAIQRVRQLAQPATTAGFTAHSQFAAFDITRIRHAGPPAPETEPLRGQQHTIDARHGAAQVSTCPAHGSFFHLPTERRFRPRNAAPDFSVRDNRFGPANNLPIRVSGSEAGICEEHQTLRLG